MTAPVFALFLDIKSTGDLNRLDAALLPIGDNYTMGIDNAVIAVEFLRPRIAIPMHYNTFDTINTINTDPALFVEKVQKIGASAKVLKVVKTIDL